jgi:tRNA 2-thiouridine synthesizing protein E
MPTKCTALSSASPDIATDKDGFLRDLAQWNEETAAWLSRQEGIALSEAHWEILHLVREFYQRFHHSPEMRPLVKFTRQQLGESKGNSLYLLSLFPDSPAKRACKIAGLPRPANCL